MRLFRSCLFAVALLAPLLLAPALAQGTEFPAINWGEVLSALLQTLLTVSGGTLAAGAVVWVVDLFCRLLPPLRPFRDLLVQWLMNLVEGAKQKRAERVVLQVGQEYKAKVASAPDKARLLKQERATSAVELLEQRGIASGEEARRLIESAVGRLKSEGVNP